ncbi:MAG: M15 family metallopeptidase [Nocardioides sp.]
MPFPGGRGLLGAVLATALVAGCAGTPEKPAAVPTPESSVGSSAGSASPSGEARTSTPAAPEPSAPTRSGSVSPGPHLDTWKIGAHVLPLAPDGFGVRRPTPKQLRVRIMPTIEALPPPPTDAYRSSVGRITPWVRDRMGTSWSKGCPVGLKDLRYVRVTFYGFDHQPHTGELIVRKGHARPITTVFRKLYAARFPIEQMTLPTSAERDLTPTGDGNGTGATVCRPTTGQTFWSAHALGLAIDVNPFQNPYVKGDLVLPELAGAYTKRSWHRPGMILPGGVVVRAFASIGWEWGGAWHTLKDYQHFSPLNR